MGSVISRGLQSTYAGSKRLTHHQRVHLNLNGAPRQFNKRNMTMMKKGYVICAEHRSGSTLLCQLLSATGNLGRPDEVFRSTEFCLELENNPTLFEDVLNSVSTENGIYGIKLFSSQFDVTMRARWISSLENPVFVYLERRDSLSQAISFVKAIQSGQYFSSETANGRLHYDTKLIAKSLARIADAGARWRRYFARNGIIPIWLVYEEMVEDPGQAVAQIAEALKIECPPLQLERVSLAIQRDKITNDWKERFVKEKGDISYLDATLGPLRTLARRAARDLGYFIRSARR
jgi:LPS sulfotransferase NodH